MAELRWNCEIQGCRVECAHPMMHDFDGPFGTNPPRKIQVSDIDCTIEVDGYFLFVEFKSHYEMSGAQERYYAALSKLKGAGGENTVTVFYVVGDANKRHSEAIRECRNGVWGEWETIDWPSLIDRVQTFRSAAQDRYREALSAKRAATISARSSGAKST